VVIWWEGKEYVYEVQEVFESTQKPEIQEDELYLNHTLYTRQTSKVEWNT
jgi:hypothetical protein